MRYYTVEIDGAEKVAVSANGKDLYILPQFADMNELIAKGGVAQIPEDAGKVVIPEDAQAAGADVKVLSPIPRPKQDVLCLGINYAARNQLRGARCGGGPLFQRGVWGRTAVSDLFLEKSELFSGTGRRDSFL